MIKMLRVSTEVPLTLTIEIFFPSISLSILSTGGVQGDGHCEARRISLSSTGIVFSTAFAIINKCLMQSIAMPKHESLFI